MDHLYGYSYGASDQPHDMSVGPQTMAPIRLLPPSNDHQPSSIPWVAPIIGVYRASHGLCGAAPPHPVAQSNQIISHPLTLHFFDVLQCLLQAQHLLTTTAQAHRRVTPTPAHILTTRRRAIRPSRRHHNNSSSTFRPSTVPHAHLHRSSCGLTAWPTMEVRLKKDL